MSGEDSVAQFCGITGASTKDARKFLERYKRLDVAIDAYYNNPNTFATSSPPQRTAAPSTSNLRSLFVKYKDKDSDTIDPDGTIKFCEDLDVNPEDVVLLAVALELGSKTLGEWTEKGWIEGWKKLRCDDIPGMKSALPKLRSKLGEDSAYFEEVYKHTFGLALSDGQRSLGAEYAIGFWQLLLPLGINGGALSHVKGGDGEDVDMEPEEGWKVEYNDWWFEFLTERNIKGISKDTWHMFLKFVRSINSTFSNYDESEAWPSLVDDFVAWVRKTHLKK